ncbi:1-hydroxycarotenoid 3,4-desaturase CrtD [Peijinzhouia sedimentorum]
MKKAIIIGSGIAGLAAAVRLKLKGYDVVVFEANSYAGGKLSEIQLGAYRFDAGPSLFTMPELVDELFTAAGKNPKDYFNYQQLAESCRYFWEDGTQLTASSNRAELFKEIEDKLGEPPANLEKALSKSAALYDTLADLFMFKPIHKLSTWLGPKAFKAYTRLHTLNFNRSMADENRRLFKTEKAVQLFNRYATYNGSDPYQAPATLNIIPHLEFNRGAFFPIGGMHSITQSILKLAQDLGIAFHFGHKVEEIKIENNACKAVIVNGQWHSADLVVSNMDMVNTYRKLLSNQKQPERLLRQPKSSSALIFYWGIKKSFPALGLHNIFFSDDYKDEFDQIFNKGTISSDPTIYVNITSKMQTTDAGKGGENWFTMINVPNNQGQDWDQLIAEAKQNIIAKLSRLLKVDLAAYIEEEDYLDPRRIESKTSSSAGSLYGNSSNNPYAAFLRHPHQHHSISNLYFCGGSVHPGGGIPLSLLSAKQMVDYYVPEAK